MNTHLFSSCLLCQPILRSHHRRLFLGNSCHDELALLPFDFAVPLFSLVAPFGVVFLTEKSNNYSKNKETRVCFFCVRNIDPKSFAQSS